MSGRRHVGLTAALLGLAATAMLAVVLAISAVAPRASPTMVRIASDRYGFVAVDTTLWIRSETDPAPIITIDNLGAASAGSAVAASPDGRAIAVWTSGSSGQNELRLWRASSFARTEVLVSAPDGERGMGVAWASDGSALVLSFDSLSGPTAPPMSFLPDFSVLRTLDLATRQVTHVARIASTSLRPLAWDRARSVVAAADIGGGGFARAYFVIRDGEPSRTRLATDRRHTFQLSASADATWIAGSASIENERRIVAWPLAEPERMTDLRPAPGRALMSPGWLGRVTQLLVSELDPADPNAQVQVSLWDPSRGLRSTLVDAVIRGVSARVDGSALYIHGRAGETELLEPRTGQREALPSAPAHWVASVVLR